MRVKIWVRVETSLLRKVSREDQSGVMCRSMNVIHHANLAPARIVL